jgi:hypothetical protein
MPFLEQFWAAAGLFREASVGGDHKFACLPTDGAQGCSQKLRLRLYRKNFPSEIFLRKK